MIFLPKSSECETNSFVPSNTKKAQIFLPVTLVPYLLQYRSCDLSFKGITVVNRVVSPGTVEFEQRELCEALLDRLITENTGTPAIQLKSLGLIIELFIRKLHTWQVKPEKV